MVLEIVNTSAYIKVQGGYVLWYSDNEVDHYRGPNHLPKLHPCSSFVGFPSPWSTHGASNPPETLPMRALRHLLCVCSDLNVRYGRSGAPMMLLHPPAQTELVESVEC